ncbi:hypothetical protein [Burkholderia ubonensis]|uniref:hypothetical protein n=1 Tax=Burkholderia ubonensis TaxID=101571 RepID=UPI00075CAA89|nr:hypothetical protein [Burkholderia ubonensis]KVO11736.1 hypothetical protein WJ73_19500 [Burkholderia ubonensis]
MSRSGYSDDCDDQLSLILWRGAVKSAIRGKRGQDALRELAAAMDAMPRKTLAAESLVTGSGEFCTLGVLGHARGLNMDPIDPDDWDAVAKAFGIAPAMVREIVYENDEGTRTYEWIDIVLCGPMRPMYPHFERHVRTVRVAIPEEIVATERWQRMRKWVDDNLQKAAPAMEAN